MAVGSLSPLPNVMRVAAPGAAPTTPAVMTSTGAAVPQKPMMISDGMLGAACGVTLAIAAVAVFVSRPGKNNNTVANPPGPQAG